MSAAIPPPFCSHIHPGTVKGCAKDSANLAWGGEGRVVENIFGGGGSEISGHLSGQRDSQNRRRRDEQRGLGTGRGVCEQARERGVRGVMWNVWGSSCSAELEGYRS